MAPLRGTALLVQALIVLFVVVLGRGAFQKEGPPAFFVEAPHGVAVRLGEGFPEPGVHQFYDGATPATVIKLAKMTLPVDGLPSDQMERPLAPGEYLGVFCSGSQVVEIKRQWMPARQRMALLIPLHPDRMNLRDWQALPGIGPKLAETIEKDRQNNGDFGAFESLERVRGIGPAKMKAWRRYF